MVARRAFLQKHKKSIWKIDRKMIDREMRKSSLARACSHFRRFSKSMKTCGKIDPKRHPKSFKTDPWGGQGRFIDICYWFWAVSKNRYFLMLSWCVYKLLNIPWAPRGRQVRHDPSPEWWLLGSGADGGPRARNYWCGGGCLILHADRRWPGEYVLYSSLYFS